MQLLQSTNNGACVNTSTLLNSTSPAQTVDDVVPSPQYAIAANATLQERRTRTLKHGDTFAVFDQRGDIGGGAGKSQRTDFSAHPDLLPVSLVLPEGPPPLLPFLNP